MVSFHNLKTGLNLFTDIRSLYTPRQPSTQPFADSISYKECLPALVLQSYIYCYWELKTTRKLTNDFVYQVVADGCTDVFFERHTPHDAFVMGFCKEHTPFSLGNSFHYIGIRFLPAAFTQLFWISALELANRTEVLSETVPDLAAYISRHFAEHAAPTTLQTTLDSFFCNYLKNNTPAIDSRLSQAMYQIVQQAGLVRVETDLSTGIGQRQLRRLFDFYLGETPKKFSQIVRFQHFLNANPTQQRLKESKLFFDYGYYDQAHFIKEFKKLYGLTPSQAFVDMSDFYKD